MNVSQVLAPNAAQSPTEATQATGARATVSERDKARKAAQDFEAIFVRQLLAPLEKAQGFGGKSDTGHQIYGSLMVGALADAATRGQGLGLADLIANALVPPTDVPKSTSSGPANTGQPGISRAVSVFTQSEK